MQGSLGVAVVTSRIWGTYHVKSQRTKIKIGA